MAEKQNDTQKQLTESFKTLLVECPFDSITIKMITDGADVIRPTFYNYFRDKYDSEQMLEAYSVLMTSDLRDLIERRD